MARRVGVDLVALLRTEVGGCAEEARAERQHLLVRGGEVLDVQVEVHLLPLGPVRP